MATARITMKRGNGMALAGMTVTAGAAEAQSDTVSINMDVTNLSQGEAAMLIETMKQRVLASPVWPLV